MQRKSALDPLKNPTLNFYVPFPLSFTGESQNNFTTIVNNTAQTDSIVCDLYMEIFLYIIAMTSSFVRSRKECVRRGRGGVD